MRRLVLVATLALLPLTAVAATAGGQPTGQDAAAQDEGTRPLNEATSERLRRQREDAARIEARGQAARERIRLENERVQREYQEQLRARERAIAEERARYEAEMARYRASLEEAERRPARGETRPARAERRAAEPSRTRRAEASAGSCEEQRQRARRTGRTVGGVLGGVAGVIGGRNLGRAARLGVAVASVPIGALIGEAIASRLDCREQEQAAVATEQAVEQAAEAGVGRSVAWRSETRDQVSGTSTVTAVSAPAQPGLPLCMTVTDVIIVDGEETRAEKQMCRRPPSNRFVRV
ncbi:MAG TPA: hypothetical protein VMG08_13655 [Allosphingosinicella sp.]|nr:hypothetical protein [Allosphingosinicella sp.]